MKIAINEIDESIDLMTSVLQQEMRGLEQSFDLYLHRIRRHTGKVETKFEQKLHKASRVFEDAKKDSAQLAELIEPLQHIKQVNKMVRFAMSSKEDLVNNVTSYIDSISNVCLGQIKYIKSRYERILDTIKVKITKLWLDRELAEKLKLILSVNHILYQKFEEAFHRAEVLYADFTIAIKCNKKDEVFHRWIVLRMISNRLNSREEQQIINSLFPKWDSSSLINHE
ncbi:hypothetical protein [Pseudochryseolinea flava]|nr:hypothetical protein [Pseudochryseolinea flava]